jgi:3-hydroxyisobutyrate dehydrogenase
VFTSLPGPGEVSEVVLGEHGLVHGVGADSVYVDLSTIPPSLIRRIHRELAGRGCHVLDAPVSGGPGGAERGTLQLMVGGEEAIYERVLPALRDLGDKVSHIGEIGAGSIAKLCHNTLGYCANLALAEVFTLAVKAGVRPERLLEAILGGGYGQGLMLTRKIPDTIFQGRWEPAGFQLALARKDVGLTTELAREHDVPMTVASLVEQEYIEALARGWGAKDSSTIWALQEQRAGVEVRSSDR